MTTVIVVHRTIDARLGIAANRIRLNVFFLVVPLELPSASNHAIVPSMDTWFSDAVASGVTMYLILFALVVFGGIAFYVGYRAFGIVLLCGAVLLLAALALGMFA
ncbi:MAG: hypothetical protein ACREEE_15190 [Dongiaceae bacterium]